MAQIKDANRLFSATGPGIEDLGASAASESNRRRPVAAAPAAVVAPVVP